MFVTQHIFVNYHKKKTQKEANTTEVRLKLILEVGNAEKVTKFGP